MRKVTKLTKKPVDYQVKYLGESDDDYINNKVYHCKNEFYLPNGELFTLGVQDEEGDYEMVDCDDFQKILS